MGCTASAPLEVDTLPIKAHYRAAFARCSTTEELNVQSSDKNLVIQADQGHDVVLCYPLGGTVFGLELQARYEKMLDSVSLWTLDHFLSLPGTPAGLTKSMSGGMRSGGMEPALEIKPAPEAAAASTPNNMALSREVRLCHRGVVVLLTAGCTWDEDVLTCLRLAGKFLRPLVLVHCVQSCPRPALDEWPLDIRPLIAACGPPVKYLAQHSAEALRVVEQRMLAAAEALAAAAGKADAKAAQHRPAAEAPTVMQTQTPSQRQLQQPPQQQQPAAVTSFSCSCLEAALPASPPGAVDARASARQRQPPSLASAACAAATAASAKFTPVAAAGDGSRAGMGSGAASRRLSPLSLAALQASDSDICRRASQLLGPWTSAGAGSGGDFHSQCAGRDTVCNDVAAGCNSTSTPIEAHVASARPSYNGHVAATEVAAKPSASLVAVTGEMGQRSQHPAPSNGQEQGRGQGARGDKAAAAVTASGGGGVQCVLRYRDSGWATPVAFVCAQLEAELGWANVSVQTAAGVTSAATAAWNCSPSTPTTGGLVGISSHSGDRGGGQWSRKWLQQQQQHDGQHALSAAVAAAAAAAAAALPGCQRRSSASSTDSSASGRCCTARGGPRTGGVSEATSLCTSGGVTTPFARTEDELEPFVTTSNDNSSTPLMGPTVAASSAFATTSSGGRQSAADRRSIGSWGEDDASAPPPLPGSSVAATSSSSSSLVHFMTPGLSAPLGCLAELGEGLASGRRVLLVVDGECCQRLPEHAPAGMTAEAWRAIKRLWRERLLYVPDYHSSFCALLQQGITASAAAAADASTGASKAAMASER